MDFTLLKQHTQANHDRLEAHPLTAQLMAPTLTKAAYLDVLQAFYGYYLPIERTFAAWAVSLPQLQLNARRKVHLLADDIQYLASATELDRLPVCEHVPAYDAPAAMIGCLYVLEGATLGGQIISRHLTQQIGVRPDAGMRFFSGYAEQTGAMWKAFRQVVTDCVQDEHTETAVIEAACQTFDTFERWLHTYATKQERRVAS